MYYDNTKHVRIFGVGPFLKATKHQFKKSQMFCIFILN